MNSYTYEKLHVWKVTRIEYWVLIGALLYAYRFFHGTFDTRMFSNVKLFIRGTFGAFCPLRPTIAWCCQPHGTGRGRRPNLKIVDMDGWMDSVWNYIWWQIASAEALVPSDGRSCVNASYYCFLHHNPILVISRSPDNTVQHNTISYTALHWPNWTGRKCYYIQHCID